MRLWIRIFFCFKSKIAKNCKSLTIFYKSLIPLGLKKVHYYTSILYPFSLSILAFSLGGFRFWGLFVYFYFSFFFILNLRNYPRNYRPTYICKAWGHEESEKYVCLFVFCLFFLLHSFPPTTFVYIFRDILNQDLRGLEYLVWLQLWNLGGEAVLSNIKAQIGQKQTSFSSNQKTGFFSGNDLFIFNLSILNF